MDVAEQTFGQRLKQLREEAGLTQPQLAERAGMNRFGVAKLEQGQREPSWDTVQRLAKALGVGCSAFEGTVSAEDEPAPPSKRGRPRKAPGEAAPEADKPEGKKGKRKGRG
jgi:transcriptional regulator with XRE-family HTH domain